MISQAPIRSLVLLTAFALFPASVGAGSSTRGYVSHRISSCDYFLVQTANGYDLLEWYGGNDPDRGDVLVGRYEEYGFHDIVNETADEGLHIYTEDYQLSKSDGLEQLTDKCQ